MSGMIDRSLFCGLVALCYCSTVHGIKFPTGGWGGVVREQPAQPTALNKEATHIGHRF